MIMVDYCCAPGCCNKRGEKKGRAFYRLPKEEPRRSQWIAVINRAMNKKEKWDPSHGGVYRLCSEHFISVVKKQGDECQKLSGERRRLWLAKLNQDLRGKNLDNIRICSAHFLSGKKSDLYQKDNPDWVPSVGMTGQQRGASQSTKELGNRATGVVSVKPSRDSVLLLLMMMMMMMMLVMTSISPIWPRIRVTAESQEQQPLFARLHPIHLQGCATSCEKKKRGPTEKLD
ncbi:uncharacterized protein LOC144022809 isoform X4 [Festucalex cinctus]